jgi:sec-independent protein translocase protein TatB
VFFLSPAKLLLVFVVVMIVIGPEKLPSVARQLGAALESLRNFHSKVESDVRESIPNLPSTADIARMARSPSVLLNTLMDMPSGSVDDPVPDPGSPAAGTHAEGDDWPIDTGAPLTMDGLSDHDAAIASNGVAPAARNGAAPPDSAPFATSGDHLVPLGDPNMN